MKSKLKTDEHFIENEKIIKRWAGIYHKAGLGEFDDMFQKASMVYLKVCDKYDETKARFSTFLWQSLRNNMFDLIRKRDKEPMIYSLDKMISNNDGEVYSFLDTLENPHVELDGKIMKMLYRGYTMTDIATELNIDRKTAYKYLEKERNNYL